MAASTLVSCLLVLVLLIKGGVSQNLCPDFTCNCHQSPILELIQIDCKNKQLPEVPDFTQLPPDVAAANIMLDISDNSIASLESNSFPGMPGLFSVDLSNNKISTIDVDAFESQTDSFVTLILGGNEISQDQFVNLNVEHLASLNELSLSGNVISSFESDVLNKLTNLTALSLGFNKIDSLGIGVFNNFLRLKHVRLDNNTMTTIASGAFQGLVQLDTLALGYNAINNLKNDLFNDLAQLSSLNLEHNGITSIASDTFSSLNETLRLINLNGNLLESVPSKAFRHFNSLRYIYMEDNKIASIADDAFPVNGNVQWLHLEGNQLTSDSLKALSGLSAMTRVYLQNNKLTSIPTKSFYSLNSLIELSLNDNSLQTIDVDAMPENATELRQLDLYNNQLETSSLAALSHMTSISSLRLDHNNLTDIPANSFTKMTKMRELFLHSNNIQYIDDNAFPKKAMGAELISWLDLKFNQITSDSLMSLKGVYVYDLQLSYNNLTRLPQEVFTERPGRLSLFGNPVICDCDVTWLKSLGFQTDNWRCAAPPALAGKEFNELDQDTICPAGSSDIARVHLSLLTAALGFVLSITIFN